MNSKHFTLHYKFFGDVTVSVSLTSTLIKLDDSFDTEISIKSPDDTISLNDWYEIVLEEIQDCIDTEGCY